MLSLVFKLHHDKPSTEDLRIVLDIATALNNTKTQLRNPHINTREISEHETIQLLVLPEETSVIVT